MRPRPRAELPPMRPHALFSAALYMASLPDDPAMLDGIALSLGIDHDALDDMGCKWDSFHDALAIPMCDATGKVVGIRLRAMDGRKWSVAGSRDGLFLPLSLRSAASGSLNRLVVLEGATDALAGLSLGLPAVGRSSCSTGAEMLRDFCREKRVREVTIVSDNDAYKRRPDGSHWRPGWDGAVALAAAIGRMYRIWVPPCKDFRQWYSTAYSLPDGTTGFPSREAFERLADSLDWQLPQKTGKGGL